MLKNESKLNQMLKKRKKSRFQLFKVRKFKTCFVKNKGNSRPEKNNLLVLKTKDAINLIFFYFEKKGKLSFVFPGQIKPPRFGSKDSN